MTGPGLQNKLPGVSDDSDLTRGPEALLMDTMARLQLEVDAIKSRMPGHQTLGRLTSPVRSKPVMFTSTKVPRFAEVNSWEHIDRYLTLLRSQMDGVTQRLLFNYYLNWRVMHSMWPF